MAPIYSQKQPTLIKKISSAIDGQQRPAKLSPISSIGISGLLFNKHQLSIFDKGNQALYHDNFKATHAFWILNCTNIIFVYRQNLCGQYTMCTL
jgi:hypothetical protein